jgi:hypothetical protein
MSVFLIVCAVVGLIASVLTILSFFTERGRRTRRQVSLFLRRKPRPPPTHIHIEPDERFCIWSSTPANSVTPAGTVFQVKCTATNLTPAYDLSLASAALRGIGGHEEWNSVLSYRPGVGQVNGAVLPPDTPIDLMLIVQITGAKVQPGKVATARAVVSDHLGNHYRSRRIRFKPAP